MHNLFKQFIHEGHEYYNILFNLLNPTEQDLEKNTAVLNTLFIIKRLIYVYQNMLIITIKNNLMILQKILL